LRGEDSIAERCRKEGINQNQDEGGAGDLNSKTDSVKSEFCRFDLPFKENGSRWLVLRRLDSTIPPILHPVKLSQPDELRRNPGLAAALKVQWPQLAIQRCTNHQLWNLLARAPAHLREEPAEDYRRMICDPSREAVEQARVGFLRKWKLR